MNDEVRTAPEVSGATPRPWRVDHTIETEPLSGRMPQHHWHIFSNAAGPDFIVGEATKEANAQLIVAAVNAYRAGDRGSAESVRSRLIEVVKEKRDKWKRDTESHAREDPYREHCRANMSAANEIVVALEAAELTPADSEGGK